MRKPRMTKSEKAWYLANFQNLKSGLLSDADRQRWVVLHFAKTF